jgi:hypothetical protein
MGQVRSNQKVLRVLQEMTKLEDAPVHIGHFLRIVMDIGDVAIRDCRAERTEKGTLHGGMTIEDVLMRLPIHKWPPPRPQCPHPECRSGFMVVGNHINVGHNWKRDWLDHAQEEPKMKGGAHYFDGESCLVATTASLLNVESVAKLHPDNRKFSNPYRIGDGAGKSIEKWADWTDILGYERNKGVNRPGFEEIREWHRHVGDLWGPIMLNIQRGGGWLTLEEIFDTGKEHRFRIKRVDEEEPWRRDRYKEAGASHDPATACFREVGNRYRWEDPVDIPFTELYDQRNLKSFQKPSKVSPALRRMWETEEFQPEPEEPLPEGQDWDKVVEESWEEFKGFLQESGLMIRVAIEKLVKRRREQWAKLPKLDRDRYTTRKIAKFAEKRPEEMKIRDLLMSFEATRMHQHHYGCPICWEAGAIHREENISEMKRHCYQCHQIPARRCHDPFMLAISRMIWKDVTLVGVGKEQDSKFEIQVKGNYQQCCYPGCQEKVTNGVGIKKHLERPHGKDPPPDLGGWDILIAHLKKGEDTTLDQVFEEKTAFVCDEPNPDTRRQRNRR